MVRGRLTEQEINDPLLTPGQVAEILGVDPRTVTRWAREGLIACIRTPGGHRRYRRSDVDHITHREDTTDAPADS